MNTISKIERTHDFSFGRSYVELGRNRRPTILMQWDYGWDATLECLTPKRQDPKKRIYKKSFHNLRAYLPHEQETAFENELWITRENVQKRSNVIVSMVGYSSLKWENPELWGVSTQQYESFAKKLYARVMHDIRKSFPELEIMSIDGASDMGIDRPLIEHRLSRNVMRGLSFSCPEYIGYVKDTVNAVFIAETADTYLEVFAALADVMITLGGRDAAHWKNYLVSRHYYPERHKCSPVWDPIAVLSKKFDLPYYKVDADPFSQSKILNASKAIMRKALQQPDKTQTVLIDRISQEVISFLKNDAVFLMR